MKFWIKQGLAAATVCFLSVGGTITLAEEPQALTPLSDVIKFDNEPKGKFQLSAPVETLDSPLKAQITGERDLSSEDSQNLSMLWQAVIQRSPVIQYGLKQLATPPELRYAQSSIMSRTVAGLLSGASMLPYALGADQYTSSAAVLGRNLIDRAMHQSKKVDPNQLPSDTELVELSGFVQALQKTLVNHYFEYKHSLANKVQLEQSLYKLRNQNPGILQLPRATSDLWNQHVYQSMNDALFATQQDAKYHYLVLERLVGVAKMRELQFKEMPLYTDNVSSTPLGHHVSSQPVIK